MNAGRTPARLPEALLMEIETAGLVCLSRARMTPNLAGWIPARSALVFAPPASAESLS
jgi:hypothetical protein